MIIQCDIVITQATLHFMTNMVISTQKEPHVCAHSGCTATAWEHTGPTAGDC